MSNEFRHPDGWKIGDFVYHNKENDIGRLIQIPTPANPNAFFRVNYCQNKQISPSSPDGYIGGGDGPILERGYPKKISDAKDLLFVRAAQLSKTAFELSETLDNCKKKIEAFEIARKCL